MKKTFDRFKEVTTLYEEKSLGEDDIVIYKRFNDVTFSDEIKFFSFDNVEFINCKFEGNIKNSVFHILKFEKCEMSNITLEKCGIQKCFFDGCHMIGISFLDSNIKNSDFVNSNMMMCNISGVTLKLDIFENVKMTSATITNLSFDDLILNEVDLSESEFYKTSLSGLDLTNSTINGIVLESMDLLRGVIVNELQALDFINLLGIIIK